MIENPVFRFIDLFAGIGGFHIAMHKHGGKCVYASEIDKYARQTYETNFKSISPDLFDNGCFNEDITNPKLDYKTIPDFDVLCAGFPCQPFSNAGLKKGFDDTRGTLFFSIKEIIKSKIEEKTRNGDNEKIPKVLILENVKGFRNHDKGRTYEVVKRTLENLGYNVTSEILNSKFFGVPQNRERIFIIAWYRELIKKNAFIFPHGLDENGQVIYSKEARELLSKNTKVGDILLSPEELEQIEAEKNKTYTISQRLWDGHLRRRAEHRLKGNGFGYNAYGIDSTYTSTISARYYKDGSEILIRPESINGITKRPRKLHPVEAARLQGFPVDEWYKIPVSDNQAYKQFGNSVTIPVVSTLASEIINQFFK